MPRRPARLKPWCSFGVWGIGSYPPGYKQSGTTLTDHDLVWIIEGCPTYWIDDRECRAEAPCVMLLRPGQTMRIRWDPRRVSRNCYIHFTPRAAQAHVPAAHSWPRLTALPEDDVVRPSLRHIAALLGARPAEWEILAAAALGYAVGALCAGSVRGTAVAEAQTGPLVRAVVGHLARIWQPGPDGVLRSPSLAELARALDLTRESLCRGFRAEIGVSPLLAVRRMRLERAAHLLLNRHLTVGAVALQCGFTDPFHFSRTFHTAYGCMPSRFQGEFLAGRAPLLLPSSESLVAFRCELASAMRWHD